MTLFPLRSTHTEPRAGRGADGVVVTRQTERLHFWNLGAPLLGFALAVSIFLMVRPGNAQLSALAQLVAALAGTGLCALSLLRLSRNQYAARVACEPGDTLAPETPLPAPTKEARPFSHWRERWPWWLIGASLGCFGVGQAIVLSGQIALLADGSHAGSLVSDGEAPMLSERLWWTLQYPLLWAGLLLLTWPDDILFSLRSREDQSNLARVVTDRLIVVLAVLLLFWTWLQNRFDGLEHMDIARSLVAYYPLADMGHVFCALILISAARRRLASATLSILLAALAVLIVTDSVYTYQMLHGLYRMGTPLDAGWVWAFLLLGIAAFNHAEHAVARETMPSTSLSIAPLASNAMAVARRMVGHETLPRGSRRYLSIWMPYVMALGACSVLIGHEIAHGSSALQGVLPIVALMLAVVARQMLTIADNMALTERLGAANADLARLNGDLEAANIDLEGVNQDLERNVNERTRHLATLHGITSTLNSSLDKNTILRLSLNRTMEAVQADAGGIWLRGECRTPTVAEEEDNTRSAQSPNTQPQSTLDSSSRWNEWASECLQGLGDDPALHVALRERTILAALAQRAPRLESWPEAAREAHRRLPDDKGLILVPIRWQGVMLGALGLMKKEGAFGYDDHALVESVALEAGTALQNARLYQDASHRADRDSITELFNHRAMQEHLQTCVANARQRQSTFAVVMMDLNNFKFFNDVYGHLVGDDVLRTVARCLAEASRTTDFAGRYGGDEFIAILPDSDAEGAREMCCRIAQAMDGRHFEAGGAFIPIGMSFGWAVYPEDGETSLELTTHADADLYENKRRNGANLKMPHGDVGLHAHVRGVETRRLKDRSMGGSFGVLDALVTAIDNKDHYTRHHSEEVTHLALLMAEELGYEPDLLGAVRISGLLHDVGKIAVPDAILRHPGRLGPEESEIMKQHPVFGALIVKDVAHQEVVVVGVRHHHERWDGRGYPDGLAATVIPWMGRLLAVPDCYSAMTTDRPYRKALSPESALQEIERSSRTQFDPDFAAIFVRVMRRELEKSGHSLGASSPPLDLLTHALPTTINSHPRAPVDAG